MPFQSKRYGDIAAIKVKNCELILLKPSTFMNLSGQAVRYWMNQEKLPLENLLVVVDDLAIPFGHLRLRKRGSDAGHNGLKNIADQLCSTNYARLRFGVGNGFPRGGQIDYVLGRIPPLRKNALNCRHCCAAPPTPSRHTALRPGIRDEPLQQLTRKDSRRIANKISQIANP